LLAIYIYAICFQAGAADVGSDEFTNFTLHKQARYQLGTPVTKAPAPLLVTGLWTSLLNFISNNV